MTRTTNYGPALGLALAGLLGGEDPAQRTRSVSTMSTDGDPPGGAGGLAELLASGRKRLRSIVLPMVDGQNVAPPACRSCPGCASNAAARQRRDLRTVCPDCRNCLPVIWRR